MRIQNGIRNNGYLDSRNRKTICKTRNRQLSSLPPESTPKKEMGKKITNNRRWRRKIERRMNKLDTVKFFL